MTRQEAISRLSIIKRNKRVAWNPRTLETFQMAIDVLGMVEVLADVLDGCPLTQPCDKLWTPHGWCDGHCKDGQTNPDAECWIKYAEVMAREQTRSGRGT